jgi:hypothetical protein
MSFGTDQELADRLSSTLETVIRGEEVTSGRDGPDAEDPLVAMPPYGWRFRGDTSLSVPRARRGDWFHRVNLDLPFRHAAALGADTVRQNQDLFAKKCWEQYEDVVEANRALQRLRFALDLGRRIVDRRLSRLASDVVVRLSEPLHPYVQVPGAQPLSQSFRSNGTPTSFASRTVRRISAGRTVRDTGGAEPRRAVPVPALPGDIDRSPSPRPPLATSPGEARAEPRFRPGLEGRLEALFARGAFSGQSRARSVGVPVRSYRSGDLSDAVLNALRTLPLAKASVLVKRRPGSRSPVEPVYRSPSVPLPLSNWMGRMSTEHLLSGIERIPPDSVTVVTENRTFVEAFLVGANHEMNAELRWKEFPTDMRGTIFRRFWDRGRPPDDRSGDEIADIHRWDGRLGSHFAPGDQDREADLVVVIRGSVVRKLGQLAVVLNEGVGDRWQRGVGVDHHPVFFGRPEPDLVYYGFDVARDHILSPAVRDRAFLVLYEPIGRLRFGLDVARASVRRERLRYESVPLSFPTATLGRSYESVPPPRPDLERSIPDRPSDWDDLSWTHVARTASGYVDFNQSIEIAGAPGYWDSNRTSATIARSFWQKPLAVVLPLARVL